MRSEKGPQDLQNNMKVIAALVSFLLYSALPSIKKKGGGASQKSQRTQTDEKKLKSLLSLTERQRFEATVLL